MKRPSRVVAVVGLLFSAYPMFVLGYTWFHVAHAKFSGGRGGQLDAYRHTLASAIVAYTLDKGAVDLVSSIMEQGSGSSNVMDRHNNRIGAQIGLQASSFSEIEAAVTNAVKDGAENSKSPDKITWLSQDSWRDSLFW